MWFLFYYNHLYRIQTKSLPADAASIRWCFGHWDALPAARYFEAVF
jgi:hypothetical protein